MGVCKLEKEYFLPKSVCLKVLLTWEQDITQLFVYLLKLYCMNYFWKKLRNLPVSYHLLGSVFKIYLVVPQELSVKLVNICEDESLFFFRVKYQNSFFLKLYFGYVMIIENSKLVVNFSPFYWLDLENKKCLSKTEAILKIEKEVVKHNF